MQKSSRKDPWQEKRVEGNKTDGAAEGRKRVYVVVRNKRREEAA